MPETIRHDHIDDLCHVAQVIWQAGHGVEFIKFDFKGAYRTVPIAQEQLDLATLLVRDTDNGQWGSSSYRDSRGGLRINFGEQQDGRTSQLPGNVGSVSELRRAGRFLFQVRGQKLVVWIKAIELALEKDALSPAAASKLAGRLLFARGNFFGKIGSAQLRRIFHRAHKSKTRP